VDARYASLEREILDTAHDAFIAVDASARVVAWNAAAERMFGWTREEVLGHDAIALLIPDAQQSRRRDNMLAALAVSDGFAGTSRELTLVRRDGTPVEVQLSVAPLRTRTAVFFNAFLRDVSALHAAAQRQRELEAVTSATSEAIVTIDVAGVISSFNGAAERLFGYEAADMIGRHARDLAPMQSDEHHRLIGEVLASGRTWTGRAMPRVKADGTLFRADVQASPVKDEKGQLCGCAVAIRPVDSDDPERRDAAALSADWRVAVERVALHGEGISIVVQPIVDLARGTVAGYEALSRFTGPPSAPPDQWFAVANALGLSGALEARAIEKALARRDELPPNTFLTVNVSPHALGTPEVQEVLQAHPRLGGVVVEITEQSHVSDYDELSVRLDELRAAGALIAVDDAGAGYASLRHIVAIRPDLVKLDRSLADGVDKDPAKAAAVEMLGGLAGRLDAWLLAEGIENEAELETLAALGVPLAQGYLLARPHADFTAPPAELAARLAARVQVVAGSVAELVESLPEGLAPSRSAMAVLPDTPVRDCALRALARPEAERYDPVVVHDELGRPVGVVRFDRLVAHLAAEP